MATEIDGLVGNEPEEITKKYRPGTYKDRADGMAVDDKLPVKAMPMKETPKSYVIKGGGNGG